MFEIRQDEGRIAFHGRWDAAQTDRARAFLDGVHETVQIDLAGLEYISSAGLGLLVKAQIRLQEQGRQMTLINAPQRVRVVFQFAGLEEFFGMK